MDGQLLNLFSQRKKEATFRYEQDNYFTKGQFTRQNYQGSERGSRSKVLF